MLQLVRTVGPKGQIVLPKDIRDHFNIRTGNEVAFDVREEEIVLRPVRDPEKWVDDFCSLGTKLKKKWTIKDLKQLIEEEYKER